MEAMDRLESSLDDRIREFNNTIRNLTNNELGRARAIATLLQSDAIDGGTGRGVSMGAILEETLDNIEEGLGKLKGEMEKVKQPCLDRVEGFLFDHKHSLDLISRIADEGLTSIVTPHPGRKQVAAGG